MTTISGRGTAQRISRQMRLGRWLPPVALFVAIILAWEFAVKFFEIRSVVLPTPGAVASSLYVGLVQGSLWPHIWVTFVETMAGFGFGALFGLISGVLVAEFRPVRRFVYPYLVGLQAVPKIAIAPLFVLWLGFGMESKVAIAATISFFPVVVNVIAGMQSLDDDIVEMMRAFGASRYQVFWHARARASLPFVFAGLDIAIVLSIIGAIVAEFVGATQGLGFLILQANYQLDIAQVFAILTVLAIMGLGLHSLIEMLNRRLVFWQRRELRTIGA